MRKLSIALVALTRLALTSAGTFASQIGSPSKFDTMQVAQGGGGGGGGCHVTVVRKFFRPRMIVKRIPRCY